MGEICRKQLLKKADTDLKENCSVLFSMTISGPDTLILYLGEVLHLLRIQRGKNKEMRNIIFPA